MSGALPRIACLNKPCQAQKPSLATSPRIAPLVPPSLSYAMKYALYVPGVVGAESSHVDWTGIRDTLKEDVATYVHTQTRRRPLVLPITVEV